MTHEPSLQLLRPYFADMKAVGLIAFLAMMTATSPAGGLTGVKTQDDFSIGNAHLELRLQKKGDQVGATSLINRGAHRRIELTSDDFALSFEGSPNLHMANFTVRQIIKELVPGGQKLSLHLTRRGGEAEVAIIYELMDADFFIRRHLEFCCASPVLLREVDVWNVGLKDQCWSQEKGPPEYLRYNVWGVEGKQGFGQPVFLQDTFWGLEFPAGYNHYESGLLTLRHRPGRSVSGRFTSKVAVLGVASRDQLALRFRAYIDQGRKRPRKPEVQVDYNTWTTVSPATETNSLDLIRQFKQKLFEPYGVGFDSFTLDDGWDEKESLWELRASGFPRGFKPLLDELKPMGSRLGLWLSPSSGYEHARWGGNQGYHRNATFDWFLCQSDPGYRRDISRRVPELIRENDAGFFKMDGFCASCDTNTHPHHLDGDYAREANVDAFIELLTAMRRAKPDVYLDPTSGMWLSPWWLWHVDSVYGDTYDGTPPTTVPSMNGFDGATTSRDALLRRRVKSNPGFDPGAIETLGVYLDPTLTTEPANFYDNWQDNAMMVAGRGNRLLTFYMNPARFPDPARDWPFLAGMIQWTRHNAPVLSRTRMILGDPYRREPYGYAHFRGQNGILVLRNPFIQPQTVRIKLDESTGWTRSESGTGRYTASVIYPYRETLPKTVRFGDSLELEPAPYQTLFLQLKRPDPTALSLPGLRCREVNRTATQATWEVFGHPGETVQFSMTGLPAAHRVSFNGQDVFKAGSRGSKTLALPFSGKRESGIVSGGALSRSSEADGATLLTGRCNISIPIKTKAWIYLLCSSPTNAGIALECHAAINARPVAVTLTSSSPADPKIPVRTMRELPAEPWAFYRFELPAGKSAVEIFLRCGKSGSSSTGIKAGWWVRSEESLEKATLTMDFAQPLPKAPLNPLPFPSAMEIERKVLTLQPLSQF